VATTLTVKNEHSSAVEVVPDTKAAKVTIDPGATADLDAAYLSSRSFLALLDEGKLGIVVPAAPTADQYKLARIVLPPVVGRVASRYATLHGQLDAAARRRWRNSATGTTATGRPPRRR
jgi:hypothetical protein